MRRAEINRALLLLYAQVDRKAQMYKRVKSEEWRVELNIVWQAGFADKDAAVETRTLWPVPGIPGGQNRNTVS